MPWDCTGHTSQLCHQHCRSKLECFQKLLAKYFHFFLTFLHLLPIQTVGFLYEDFYSLSFSFDTKNSLAICGDK